MFTYACASLVVAFTFVSSTASFAGHSSLSAPQASWSVFSPAEEDIALELPARPTFRQYAVAAPMVRNKQQLEVVLDHREYGGFGNGLIYIIESFKAERPEKLSENYLNLSDPLEVFERQLFFDGITARQYRRSESSKFMTYTRRRLRFTTGSHLYVITMATDKEDSAAVEQLLSSIRLRKPGEPVTPTPVPEEMTPEPAYLAADVGRRAVIVWKQEPTYTEEARQKHVRGQVLLRAVFAANGYVSGIVVTKGLEHGLTEQAIEAARNIRFFPALKDGKPVSLAMVLEYQFDLY